MSDEVQVWSETVKIPTYKIGTPDKNPMFLEKRVYQGSLFLGGRLIADNYNNGTPWRVGLKRFWPEALTQGLVARFWPLRKGQVQNISTPMANRMEFEGEEIWRLLSFTVIPEYAARLS